MVFRVWGHPWDIQFLVQGTLAGSVLIANSNLLVDQSMATQLSAGGLSTLRYAYRINDLPLQLIVLALSKAILPFVSEQVCDGDSSGLRRIFAQSLASLGLIAFPVIALVMLFAGDIVVVLLRRGAFDAEAARHTVLALRCYTGGLFFFPYACINGAFFCALRRAHALFVMGIVSVGLNFGLNGLFLRLMGGGGSHCLVFQRHGRPARHGLSVPTARSSGTDPADPAGDRLAAAGPGHAGGRGSVPVAARATGGAPRAGPGASGAGRNALSGRFRAGVHARHGPGGGRIPAHLEYAGLGARVRAQVRRPQGGLTNGSCGTTPSRGHYVSGPVRLFCFRPG